MRQHDVALPEVTHMAAHTQGHALSAHVLYTARVLRCRGRSAFQTAHGYWELAKVLYKPALPKKNRFIIFPSPRGTVAHVAAPQQSCAKAPDAGFRPASRAILLDSG